MTAADRHLLTPAQREAIAAQIGDAKPATSALLESFGKSVQDRREHEHPQWEDFYCMNLSSYMGERMAPVLRRLLDVEAELAELRGATEPIVYRAEYEPEPTLLGLYTTRDAAKAHCAAHVRSEQPDAHLAWYYTEPNERAPEELYATEDGEESTTGYVVAPLKVASEYDLEADE